MTEEVTPTHNKASESHVDLTPLYQIRNTHLSHIDSADRKAAFLLGCSATVFLVFAAHVAIYAADIDSPVYYIAGSINLISCIASVALALTALVPRMKATGEEGKWRYFVRSIEGQEEQAPTYFLGILSYTPETFAAEMRHMCEDRQYALERFTSQVYVLARICKKKFIYVGASAHFLYASLFLTVFLVMLSF